MAGSSCLLALELDGRVDADALAARIRDAAAALEELRYRLAGSRWRGGAAVPELTQSRLDGAPFDAAVARLGARDVGGTQPWRVELCRGARDTVMLHWFHPFSDALGAGRLLSWIGGGGDPPPAGARWRRPETRLSDKRAVDRWRMARAFARNAAGHRSAHIASLTRLNGSAPGKQRVCRIVLDGADTAAFDRALGRRAQRADTSVLAWAAARMLDRVFAARGVAPARYLIPVPLSLDRKGERQRMFGNNVSMMMLSLDRDALADEAAAMACLAEQRRAVVRDGADLGMVAALDLLRPLPSRLVDWLSRRPFGGLRASLLLSSPGELGVTSFMGRAVRDAFALTTIPPDPGFMLVAQRFAGRLSLIVSHCDGYLDPEELASGRAALLADLIG